MQSNALLLPAELPIGAWLEDETLFSLVSRYHRISGNRLASTTCRAFFGHTRQGSAHDFPCRLDEFTRNTQGCFGSTESLIDSRTVLPFFFPLSSPELIADAIASMRSNAIGSLKYKLGLLTSRFGAAFPLKACASCMDFDRAESGVAYWHREHQLPGVWVCAKHECLLLQSTMKATGRLRFGWHLPEERRLVAAFENPSFGPSLEPAHAIARLARAAVAWAQLPKGFRFDISRLERCYRERLVRYGLASSAGRLQNSALARSFLDISRQLAVAPELQCFATTLEEARSQATRFFHRTSSVGHPLRHLMVVAWLFESWDDFIGQYAHIEPTEESRDPGSENAAESRDVLPTAVDYQPGQSARETARNLGVDVATAMVRLARAGIAVERRPKKIGREMRNRMIVKLRAGCDKSEICSAFGVSDSSVNRLLHTEVGLYDAWLVARSRRAKTAARKDWDKQLTACPLSPIAELRAIEPAVYAWLYRHDRAWLAERNSRHAGPSAHGGLHVDWDARDVSLSSALQAALASLAATLHRRISLADLVAAVPALKPKLGQLDRLPLTRAVLARARIGRSWKAHPEALI